MESAGDGALWAYTAGNDRAIVSKEGDFRPTSFLRGVFPKVIWCRCGNGPTTLAARSKRCGQAFILIAATFAPYGKQ